MSPEAKRGLPHLDIPRVLEAVPNYTQFMTGQELVTSSWKLLKTHSDMVANGKLGYEMLGESTEGRNIELLRVGKGKKKALWVGTPHPNEPIGTLAIDFMSQYLCENPSVLEASDTTFLFIKNADPDGLALNESWLKGGMDPLKYALGFYRPPMEEQVEWTFPIDHETLHFDRPMKETQTVMRALHKYQPNFLYSLHNAAFGGAYYYFKPHIDELFDPLQNNVIDNGLILREGDAEVPYVEKWAQGIYQSLSVRQEYDYYKEYLEGDPAEHIASGAGISDYLGEIVPGHTSLISEVPYFTADALKDTSLSKKSRRTAIIEGSNARLAIINKIDEHLASLDGIPDSKRKRAIEGNSALIRNHSEANKKNAMKDEYNKPATVAEAYKEIQCQSYYQVIQLGQVYQLAVASGELGKAEEIKRDMEDILTDINEVSQIRVNPLQSLVRAQIGAGLLVIQHMRNS